MHLTVSVSSVGPALLLGRSPEATGNSRPRQMTASSPQCAGETMTESGLQRVPNQPTSEPSSYLFGDQTHQT